MQFFKKERNLLLALGALGWLQLVVFFLIKSQEVFIPFLLTSAVIFTTIVFLLLKKLARIDRELVDVGESFYVNVLGKQITGTFSELVSSLFGLLKVVSLFTKDKEVKLTNRKDLVNRLFNLAGNLFNPKAIKISLSEDASGLSIQNFIVGSQRYLDAEDRSKLAESHIVSALLELGNLKLGSIMLEMESSVDDDSVEFIECLLSLIATYGALSYADLQLVEDIKRLRVLGSESEAQKTGFVAGLSHEIRGPLGVILNAVELVLDGLCGDVTDAQVDTLKMVKGSTKHLLELVNDVLDFAKIESGVIEIKPKEISASDTLSDLVAVVRSQAIKKQQKILLEPVAENLAIFADKKHLRQIVINLLTNAIKYTPEGGSIRVSVEEDAGKLPSGKDSLRIKVVDTGVGIPDAESHKVFQAFQRVNDAYSLRQQGTGLGMPLSKRLVEANGGSIGFSSEVGVGSEFWIDLPFSRMKAIATEEYDGLPAVIGMGEHILMYEPEAENRDLYAKSLQQRGFQITPVSSMNELIRTISRERFDIIIADTDFDLEGNGLAGDDLIRSIRNSPKGASMPLIVLSGKAFNFDIEHFLRLGVDRCLSRPFTLSELSSSVRRLLDEAGRLNEIS